MSDLLKQKVEHIEKQVETHTKEIKNLQGSISKQDTSIAKIEVIVEELKVKWSSLERDIREVVSSVDNNKSQESETAWKEVTIESIKTIAYVAGAILAARMFL